MKIRRGVLATFLAASTVSSAMGIGMTGAFADGGPAADHVAAGTMGTNAPAPDCGLRTCILDYARYELSFSPRNRESGNNCNYYSGAWGNSGNDVCSTYSAGYLRGTGSWTYGNIKWRQNDWCADFARYVWSFSGANVTGLTPFAGSFYRANAGTSYWHPKSSGYVPQPGDAVLYDWATPPTGGTNGWGIDHVGIVESYSGGTLTTIEGNTTSDSGGAEGTFRRHRSTASVVGYVSPRA
jgi:hypothetical protein